MTAPYRIGMPSTVFDGVPVVFLDGCAMGKTAEVPCTTHEERIEAAVARGCGMERQYLGVWSWVVITQADAEQAVANGEHAWLRPHVAARRRPE